MAVETKHVWGPSNDHFFKVLLRDLNLDMVAAWKDPEAFGDGDIKFRDLVEVIYPPSACSEDL